MRGLHDRGVLVSGGSRGIGLATARRFLDEGARVFVAGRDDDEVGSAVDDLRELGKVDGGAYDVGDEADVDRLAADAQRALGGIDVLINNAGIAWAGPLWAGPADRRSWPPWPSSWPRRRPAT